MKNIKLNDDLDQFLCAVKEELKLSHDFTITMHGYNAVVYKGSSFESVKRSILQLLRAIKSYKVNIEALKTHTSMDELEIERYSSCTPEDIMDSCLYVGIVTSTKEKHL